MPSGPIWRLLGRFGALGDGLGALWLGLSCSWLVSCLADLALVAGLCAHGAHMVRACAATWFSIARYPPPYKSGKKHQKEEFLKIRFVGGNAAFRWEKLLLKENCAAAAERRRRNGKRKGFWAECLVFFARRFLEVFFAEISWKNLENHTGFFKSVQN